MFTGFLNKIKTYPKRFAFAQVLFITLAYYLSVKLFAVALADVSFFEGVFPEPRQRLATGFTRSVFAQLSFLAVLLLVFRNQTLIGALRSLSEKAPRAGWVIALVASFIHALVLFVGWIENPSRILEPSFFSLSMSLVPAIDGFSQETFFRGFVILRLARVGFSKATQALTSGALFGMLHLNYGLLSSDPSLFDVLSPFLGTFVLGTIYAIAFQASNYRLLPVVTAHILLVVVIQPWLGLTYITR